MSTYELRQLLSNLVEAWPEHDTNPTVEQAREYLETRQNGYITEDDELAPDQNEDYHDALWYSI
jgi:predicted GTPase